MAVIAKVAVQAATYAIDKAYDYLLPEEVGGQAGCRVLVPFGRGNRLTEAMILSLHQAVPDKPLKAVRSLLDEEPVITERELRLALWMTRRYFCTFYDALRTVLPAAVWYHYRETWSLAQPPLVPTRQEAAVCRLLQDGPLTTDKLRQALGDDVEPLLRRMAKSGALHCKKEQSRKVRDKVVLFARLAVPAEEALALAGKSQRRREAVTFLAQNGETALHDVTYFTGVSRQTLNALEKLGVVAYREQEEYRISEKQYTVKAEELTLNDQQQRVCDTLLAQVRTETPGVTLLRGVTGSGKTVVYIRLAQELLKIGRSVMILVPEIALTPQMMARFTAYFGHEVALLHSGLRMTERYDQFKRLRRGEAHIVLGTRSAVFAPLENLGLIIMDEEQEGSYQSENAPCYHARDVAKYRCAAEGARLLLGSATPTVETFYHAQQGEYDLLELTERYNCRALPEVRIADLRQELRAGNSTVISRPLQEELAKNIAAGEQSILFLNRRGSSRQLLCPQCGYVPECPRCSVYLTYHSANDRLMCHYCGYSHAAPTVCPECGGTMHRVPEVIDCWFDSGAMPFAQHHYPFENQDVFKRQFPAQFISEAVDQTRGWFYSLMAISTLLFNQSPFRNVIVLGHVQDENGQKMSKSKGNAVDPFDALETYGADAIRWYFYINSAPWLPNRFHGKAVQEGQRKFMGTLWNTYAFFVLYANIDNFDATKYTLEYDKLPVMDKWILSKMNTMVKDVDYNLGNYRIPEAARVLQDFVDDLSNWYVRRSRERFWAKGMEQDKINAYMTLYTALVTVSKAAAPMIPFMTEEIYQNLVRSIDKDAPESIHLCDFPEVHEEQIDKELENNMEHVLDLVVMGRACRNASNIKNRQPIGKMFVKADFDLPEFYQEIVADELNVKNVKFTDDVRDFTSYSFKPQLKTVGPKYGKMLGGIKAALNDIDGNAAMDELNATGALKLDVNGQEIELFKEDLLIDTAQIEGYESVNDNGITVVLDTNLSPELLEEGFVREIISKIQTMRKEADFEVMDRIKVTYEGSEKAEAVFEKNNTLIAGEVLADEVVKAQPDGYVKEWKINGEAVTMGVEKKGE